MLLAFHSKKEIKKEYLLRVKAHQEADEIIKGKYWQGGKGCAVGCTIHSEQHSRYEIELGIPQVIARIEDGIFEGLPNDEAKAFPAKFLNAIKVGADLSLVGAKFLHWLLVDKKDGVIKFAKTEAQKLAIQAIGDLYARKIAGENISYDTWMKARSAAAAAAYAAAAAAYAADAYAAAAYAAAAYAADAYAASSNAASSNAAAARLKARSKQAKKLLELLREAPVVSSKKAA